MWKVRRDHVGIPSELKVLKVPEVLKNLSAWDTMRRARALSCACIGDMCGPAARDGVLTAHVTPPHFTHQDAEGAQGKELHVVLRP